MAPTTTTSEQTTTSTAAIDETALLYFEDLAENAVSEHAEPGSAADLYSLYLSDGAAMFGRRTGNLRVDDGNVEITYPEAGLTQTVRFSGIEVSPDGVRTFSIDGLELDGRIAASLEPQAIGNVEIQRLISYQTVSGVHLVLATVANNADLDLVLGDTPFVDSSGSQREPVSYFGPFEIRPGATAVAGIEFAGGPTAAGTIYIDGFTDDFATELSFVVEAQEPGS